MKNSGIWKQITFFFYLRNEAVFGISFHLYIIILINVNVSFDENSNYETTYLHYFTNRPRSTNQQKNLIK